VVVPSRPWRRTSASASQDKTPITATGILTRRATRCPRSLIESENFFYDEHYMPAVRAHDPSREGGTYPSLGFIVAGYSAGAHHAEEYLLDLTQEGCEGPTRIRAPEDTGVSWSGQPDAIARIVNGHGLELGAILQQDFGLAPAEVPNAISVIQRRLGAPLVNPAMPFQDAIDLVEWLVAIAIGYSRFMPGAPTVGGPIETAGISKHEGFKWVRRKHYFDARLNREGT
jgi:hypothetical protein